MGYTFVTGIKTTEVWWLDVLDTIIDTLGGFAMLIILFFVLDTTHDHISPKRKRLSFSHCTAEIEWTEVERDEEGEEIRRQTYTVKVYHTMNDAQLEQIVREWHRFRRNHEIDNRSSQDFVDYINLFTTFYADITEEGLIERLKNK